MTPWKNKATDDRSEKDSLTVHKGLSDFSCKKLPKNDVLPSKKKKALNFPKFLVCSFELGWEVGIYSLFLIKDDNLWNHEIHNI